LGSIKEILKIKKNFSQVLFKKIKDIHKTINNLAKPKPYINMMTKSLSQKQIIIPMGSKDISKFIKSSGDHVTNINCALKEIKLDTFINFIYTD